MAGPPGPGLPGWAPPAGSLPGSASPAASWSTPPEASAQPYPRVYPGPGAEPYPGSSTPGAGPLPGRAHGRIWLVVAAVVLLAVAGATGGWFFLSHRSHPAARAATAPVSAAHSRPVSAGSGATSAGGGGSAAQVSASPAPAPVNTTTPPPADLAKALAGLVVISPAANGPAAPHVAAFLSRYFQAINAKDYPAYRSMYDPTSNPAQSEAGFQSGYRTTRDSAITLAKLIPSGTGGWLATATFTSNQAPSASPAGTSCTQWRVLYVLAPAGATFALEHVPPGYHAAAQSCPS